MSTGILWQAVYWFSLPVLATLVLILLRRKLTREFPLFFCYIASGVLIDVARLLTYIGPRVAYIYVYWISDAVSTILALLATCELVWRRLFPQFQKIRFYRYLFVAGGFVVIGAVVFTALTALNSRTPTTVLPLLVRTLHTIDFLRVALLFLYVGLMLFIGRLWTRYDFGIALGLGINAAAFLTTFAVWTRYLGHLSVLPACAYDAACLIWLATFWRAEKSAVASAPVSLEMVQEARKLEESLKKSVSGKKSS